jgi:ribosomal protein S12
LALPSFELVPSSPWIQPEYEIFYLYIGWATTFIALSTFFKMPSVPSLLAIRALRALTIHPCLQPSTLAQRHALPSFQPAYRLSKHPFSTTTPLSATLNQIRNKGREPKKARRSLSPAMVGRPEMKGVCLKVGITKPKKPNSGQRKTAKIRLTSGKLISAYIPGEGELTSHVFANGRHGTLMKEDGVGNCVG